MTDFYQFPTDVLENELLRLEYLTTAGPRIVGLSYRGSANLLADVHDIVWDTAHGKYRILGGHRLWISPEYPEKTYIPDDKGGQAQAVPGGVELSGSHEPGSGVCKKIRVELEAGRAAVKLTHTIRNENSTPVTLAPWVITMLRQGGTAILPQPVGNADPNGLLHNRLLALWPYTRLNDPRLTLRDDCILIHAESSLPPVKVGYYNPHGWLAYWLDGVLFRKSFDLHPGVTYPDGGCNAEAYCGDRFIELESLGPLVPLAPDEEITLTETWEFFPTLDVPFIPAAIADLLKKS